MTTAETSIFGLLAVLLMWCSLYAIYNAFVRPILHTRFKFKLNELKDEMDLLVISNTIPPDEAYKILRARVNSANAKIDSLNLTNILLAASYGTLAPASRIAQDDMLIDCSHAKLKEINTRLNLTALGILASNSPVILGTIIVVVSGISLWSIMARTLVNKITDSFWNAIEIKDQRTSNLAHA